MTPEYVFAVASKIPPSKSQLERQNKTWPDYKLTSALTGWDGITDSFDSIQWAHAYAERGYDDPKAGILFGNWNHVSQRVQDILERMGYSLEWEDEWTTCGECGKAVRTSADSYGWQPSYVYYPSDCDITCIECLNGDAENYLETLENHPRRALNVQFSIDPAQCGYTLVRDGFENGFHPHQNDDPKAIYKDLREQGYDRVLFEIDGVGQFDISFRVWAKVIPDSAREQTSQSA